VNPRNFRSRKHETRRELSTIGEYGDRLRQSRHEADYESESYITNWKEAAEKYDGVARVLSDMLHKECAV
jgi:hypothetical protein